MLSDFALQLIQDQEISCKLTVNLKLTYLSLLVKNILKKNENTVSFLRSYDAYIDNIMETFLMGQFMDNGPLTGAYLLGYHCQRAFIYKTKEEKNAELAK